MDDYVTVTVPVSGNCSSCGQLNNATVSATAPRGSSATAVANGACGDKSCLGPVLMTGTVSVPR